jgi:hypothetical protein
MPDLCLQEAGDRTRNRTQEPATACILWHGHRETTQHSQASQLLLLCHSMRLVSQPTVAETDAPACLSTGQRLPLS